MENNVFLYYTSTVCVIAKVIHFLAYSWKRIDRKLLFHLIFVDEHCRILDEMKSDVKYLLHVHQSESSEKQEVTS